MYPSHVEGYRFRYGRLRWAVSSAIQLRVALPGVDNPDRKRLERDGIYSYRVYVPLSRPRHGKSTRPIERDEEALVVVAFRLTDEGRETVRTWREAGRAHRLALSTAAGDFACGVFETRRLEAHNEVPYGADEIAGLFGGENGHMLPRHVVARATNAEAVLEIYDVYTTGGFLTIDERSRDILQPLAGPAGFRQELPIDMKVTGDFAMLTGETVRKRLRVKYGRWGWRTRFGRPDH